MSTLTKPAFLSGPTASRPTYVPDGCAYFDVTLGQPVWRLRTSVTGWVDSAGSDA